MLKKSHSRVIDFLEKNRFSVWFLLIACLLFTLLRIPSLIEPNWYGDEGIYQVAGRALNDGRVLYRDIWDNKPPILYIIYAFSFGNLYLAKLYSLIAGLLSVIFFFLLSLQIFKKETFASIATTVFVVLFGFPVIEGNVANAENFMLLPIIAAAYLLYRYSRSSERWPYIVAGILLSIAAMTKIVAVFDMLAFIVFLLILNWENRKKAISRILMLGGSFVTIPLLFCLYFIINGAFTDFLNGVIFQNISYVGEQYGAANPTVILLFKSLLIVIVSSILFFLRKRITAATLFVYLWVAFGSFSAFFSDRPYTHYLIVLLPGFSLLAASLIRGKKERIVSAVIIVVILLFSYYHFHVYRKNIAYYDNFVQFAFGSRSVDSYQSFFDRNTPRDYKIANFIRSEISNDQTVFLLSDSAQIYALSDRLPIGKYIVAYHIMYYKDADTMTMEQINNFQPQYIIKTVNSNKLDKFLTSYELKYIMDGAKIYERKL